MKEIILVLVVGLCPFLAVLVAAIFDYFVDYGD